METRPVFVILAIDRPARFTAQETHTFALERPLICVECPRLYALHGISKALLLLWLPLYETVKKVSSASTVPSSVTRFDMFCSASRILCRQRNAVFRWTPQISAVSRMGNPFIMQLTYFPYTLKAFLLPDAIELVVMTKDFPQSRHTYRCVPSLRCPLRSTWILPHKGQPQPFANLSFVMNSSMLIVSARSEPNIAFRRSCSAAVNLLMSSNASLMVGVSSHSFTKTYV